MALRALWGWSPDVRARYRPVTSAHRCQRPSQGTSADVILAKSGEKRRKGEERGKAGKSDGEAGSGGAAGESSRQSCFGK